MNTLTLVILAVAVVLLVVALALKAKKKKGALAGVKQEPSNPSQPMSGESDMGGSDN